MPPIHEDEGDGAVAGGLGHESEAVEQKNCEFLFAHFADAHREFAMPNSARAADMAVDRYVVRRIGADEIDNVVAQKGAVGCAIARRRRADGALKPRCPRAW